MSYDTLILNQIAQSYKLLDAPTGVLSHTTAGTYDPVSGGTTGGVTTTYNVQCKLDAGSFKRLGFKFGDGLVQGGMIEISMPAKGLAIKPLPGDLVTIGGTQYQVVANDPNFAPGGTAVEYSLLVKQ